MGAQIGMLRDQRSLAAGVLRRSMSSELADSPAGRILWNATTLFYQEGIRGIGVDRLIREADVAKPTFYARYASKHALVVAYLKTWDQGWFGWLTEHTAQAGPRPRAAPAQRLRLPGPVGEGSGPDHGRGHGHGRPGENGASGGRRPASGRYRTGLVPLRG